MVKIPNTKLERNPVSIFGEKTADKHAVMTSSLSLSAFTLCKDRQFISSQPSSHCQINKQRFVYYAKYRRTTLYKLINTKHLS